MVIPHKHYHKQGQNSLTFIRRNVKTHNKQLKEAAYRTYVRPQVEYCSTIWHSWQKHLTYIIEMVQRSAAMYVQNDYHYTSSVINMLRELKWSTLKQRRNHASLTMLHKIQNKQVNVDHSHLTTTRNNKFLIPCQKQNNTWTHSFRGLYDFGTNYRLSLRMPQLYLHLQVDWTSFMLFNWCFNWVILCFH